MIHSFQYSDGCGKLLHTLHGHQGRVNCVKWIQNYIPQSENEFVSGSTDKSVVVWRYLSDSAAFVKQCRLTGRQLACLLVLN